MCGVKGVHAFTFVVCLVSESRKANISKALLFLFACLRLLILSSYLAEMLSQHCCCSNGCNGVVACVARRCG